MAKTIQVKCKGADTLSIDKLCPLQGNLKDLTEENYNRLKKQILDVGFAAPILVWKDPKTKKHYIEDGHQRSRVLMNMVKNEGYTCPPVPVSYVEAKNLKEAKRILLGMASQYGTVNFEGLDEFISEIEVDWPELEENWHFPEIKLPEEESKPLEEPEEPKEKKSMECPECGYVF